MAAMTTSPPSASTTSHDESHRWLRARHPQSFSDRSRTSRSRRCFIGAPPDRSLDRSRKAVFGIAAGATPHRVSYFRALTVIVAMSCLSVAPPRNVRPARFSEVTHDDSAACHSFRAFPSGHKHAASSCWKISSRNTAPTQRWAASASASRPANGSPSWALRLRQNQPSSIFSAGSIPPPRPHRCQRTGHYTPQRIRTCPLSRRKNRLRFPAISSCAVSDGARKRHARQYFHSVTDDRQAVEALKRGRLRRPPRTSPRKTFRRRNSQRVRHRSRPHQPAKTHPRREPTGNLDEANEESHQHFSRAPQVGHTILNGHARRGTSRATPAAVSN